MPTAAELQAAAEAAAKNQQTAEQAAMLNAAYRANQLPVTPQYATGGGAQYTAEQQADAAYEQRKHDIAFSQPRSDVRQLSGEALRISQQYAQTRNQVVGSQGVMYQGPAAARNPYREDTALGIAWEVAQTGGATDIELNRIAEFEGKEQGVDTSFIRYASDVYVERPEFKREVLTTKTGEQFTNEYWSGVPIRLNLTKAEMAAGGGMTEENINKFYRYNPETHNLDRVRSPDEGFNVDPGVHKAFGDFGGPWLLEGKYGGWSRGGGGNGGNVKGSTLVAREGALSDIVPSEATAKAPFVSARYNAPTTRIEDPTGKIFGVYLPGISEGVAFFEPKSKVVTTESRTPMEPVTEFGEPYTEGDTTFYPSTTKTGDIITKTETATPIAGSSGYDAFNEAARKALHLPDVAVGEKAAEIASSVNPFSTRFLPLQAGKEIAWGAADIVGIDTKEARKTSSEIVDTTDIYKGQYQAFYEQPALTAGSFAIGVGFKGLTSIGGAVRSKMAPTVISRGESARAAEIVASRAWNVAQVGMAGLYAADVGGRATKGFTEFTPGTVAPRLRASVVQEMYPMMLGYNAPGQIYKAAKVSNLNYQQALMAGKGEPAGRIKLSVEGEPRSATVGKYLELNKWNLDTSGVSLGAKPTYRAAPDTGSMKGIGWGISEKTTTGRFDWYVKQPVAEAVSRPIGLVKQDYRAFVMENTKIIKSDVVSESISETQSLELLSGKYKTDSYSRETYSKLRGFRNSEKLYQVAEYEKSDIDFILKNKHILEEVPVPSKEVTSSFSTLNDYTKTSKSEGIFAFDTTKNIEIQSMRDGYQWTTFKTPESASKFKSDLVDYSLKNPTSEIMVVHSHPGGDIQPSIGDALAAQSYSREANVNRIAILGTNRYGTTAATVYSTPLRITGFEPINIGGEPIVKPSAIFELSNNRIVTKQITTEYSKQVPKASDYILSKLNIGEYGRPIQPEPMTINIRQKYAPTELGLQQVSTEFGAEIIRPAYGKQTNIGLLAKKKLGFGRTPEPEIPYLQTSASTTYQGGVWSKVIREPVGDVSPELSLKAYKEQKSFFAGREIKPSSYSRFHYQFVSEAEATAAATGIYKTMPINLRAKAFVQERISPRVEDFRLAAYYPEMEVANINRASRVRLGEMFKGSKTPKGTSTLNIWDKMPAEIGRQPTPYPDTSKPVETKTSGGTLLSRVEMEPQVVPAMQAFESPSTMPVYPRGPSPIQTTRNIVDVEEEQVYRLPPGVKSPRPKQDSIQNIMTVPSLASTSSVASSFSQSFMQRQDSMVRQDSIVRMGQESRFRQDILQESRQERVFDQQTKFVPLQERLVRHELSSREKQDILTISEPRFDITQRTSQQTRQTTKQVIETEWIRTPPPPPPPPIVPVGGGGWPGGGGGGYGPGGNLGVIRWRRVNLVADQPYLARGMRDIGFGWGAGTGSFSMSKPRKSKSKKRRKK